MPSRGGPGCADGCRREGLPDALDSDGDVVDERRRALRLAQGLGVGLVILHVVDLDEEVLVGRAGALAWRESDAVAVRVDLARRAGGRISSPSPSKSIPLALASQQSGSPSPSASMTCPLASKQAARGTAPGWPEVGAPSPAASGENGTRPEDDRARGHAAGEGRELEGDHSVAVDPSGTTARP